MFLFSQAEVIIEKLKTKPFPKDATKISKQDILYMRLWEAEEERERREEERDEKRRKEDQEFFLKLMQALNKRNRYFLTGLLLLSKLQSYFVTELKTEFHRKSSLFNFQWTKILYQNNNAFLFFYIFQGLRMESVK